MIRFELKKIIHNKISIILSLFLVFIVLYLNFDFGNPNTKYTEEIHISFQYKIHHINFTSYRHHSCNDGRWGFGEACAQDPSFMTRENYFHIVNQELSLANNFLKWRTTDPCDEECQGNKNQYDSLFSYRMVNQIEFFSNYQEYMQYMIDQDVYCKDCNGLTLNQALLYRKAGTDLSKAEYITQYGDQYKVDNSKNTDGVNAITNSLFYASFFIIPIFISIIACINIHHNDKFLLLGKRKKSTIVFSKIISSFLYSYISIIFSLFVTYIFYGIKNGWGSFAMPVSIAKNIPVAGFQRLAKINVTSGYVFWVVVLLLMLLYTLFLTILCSIVKLYIENIVIASVTISIVIVTLYFIQYQLYLTHSFSHLLPFSYANPIVTLMSEANIFFEFSGFGTTEQYYFQQTGLGTIGAIFKMPFNPFDQEGLVKLSNLDLYYINALITLPLSTIILGSIHHLLIKRKDFL